MEDTKDKVAVDTASTAEESPNTATSATNATTAHGTTSHVVRNYVIAGGAVVLIGIGLWYLLEKEDRVDSSIFTPGTTEDSIVGLPARSDEGTAATVNGVPISNRDVNQNIASLSSGAAAQGADPTDLALQAQIEEQAVTMLINTELLRQAVAESDVSVSETDVEARFSQVVTEVGGAEALASRLAEVGITEEDLRADIRDELAIQALIDEELGLSEIVVSDEAVQSLYDEFGGEEAGLPPLAEIRPQIEAEIQAQQEQELVAAYLDELRAAADVVIE